MKVVNSLKSLSKMAGSRIVTRRGVKFIVNKRNAKAKARQGGLSRLKKKRYKKY